MPSSGVKQKKSGGKQGFAIVLGVFALMVLGAILMYLYTIHSAQFLPAPTPTAEATVTPSPEATPAPDTEPPVIEGARDLTVAVGAAPSYRSGVTATDETDGKVKLDIDASAVNLNQPGEYAVFYRATDKAGNRAETSITVTVVEVAGVNDDDPTADVSGEETPVVELPIPEVTEEMVNEEADRILAKILSPSMNQWEQAQAIYNYVHTKVKYVGTSDKSNWLIGAYVGFTRGRGDCYNYFACSKALLTRAGIPNVDLYRVGGNTDHYWQLVNVGSGWYHFDACPHPASYPLGSFLLDEMAVREYTEKCAAVRSNYYVYDYANCPVVPVGFPAEELPAESEAPAEGLPGETETPVESTLPAEGETPAEGTPGGIVPAETLPPEETPVESSPAEDTPVETAPAEEEALLPPGAITSAGETSTPEQESPSPIGTLTQPETSGKDEMP